jgi:hypothetical protein
MATGDFDDYLAMITGQAGLPPQATDATGYEDSGNPFDNSVRQTDVGRPQVATPDMPLSSSKEDKPSALRQWLMNMGSAATGDPNTMPNTPSPTPTPGGIGSDFASSGGMQPNVPMPQPNPVAALGPGPQQAAVAAAPGAIPQPPPMAPPVGFGAPPPGAPPMQPRPVGGPTAAAPAPLPPGAPAGGPPMNIAPQGAQPQKQQELNWLQKIITGGKPSGSQGIQQIIQGIGKGMANVQGNNKGAAFARGFGGAVGGAREEATTQHTLATQDFNNKMKALLTDSTLSLHDMQTKLTEARASYVQNGGGGAGGNSWRERPLGIQTGIDVEMGKGYRSDQAALKAQNLDPEEYKKAEADLYQKWQDRREAEYKKKGIDPIKGARGSAKNPIDTKTFTSKPGTPEWAKEFQQKVKSQGPGAVWKDPNGNLHTTLAETANPAVMADAMGANDQRQTAADTTEAS